MIYKLKSYDIYFLEKIRSEISGTTCFQELDALLMSIINSRDIDEIQIRSIDTYLDEYRNYIEKHKEKRIENDDDFAREWPGWNNEANERINQIRRYQEHLSNMILLQNINYSKISAVNQNKGIKSKGINRKCKELSNGK